jgi:hypothetical protein
MRSADDGVVQRAESGKAAGSKAIASLTRARLLATAMPAEREAGRAVRVEVKPWHLQKHT